jgi:hypothetical protein
MPFGEVKLPGELAREERPLPGVVVGVELMEARRLGVRTISLALRVTSTCFSSCDCPPHKPHFSIRRVSQPHQQHVSHPILGWASWRMGCVMHGMMM